MNIRVSLEYNEEFYVYNWEVWIDISKSTRKISPDGKTIFDTHIE